MPDLIPIPPTKTKIQELGREVGAPELGFSVTEMDFYSQEEATKLYNELNQYTTWHHKVFYNT